MYDTPVILNLHDDIRDSYIRKWMSGRLVSGRQKLMCGYPPSLARSQNTGNGILGITRMMKAAPGRFFCKKKILRIFFLQNTIRRQI